MVLLLRARPLVLAWLEMFSESDTSCLLPAIEDLISFSASRLAVGEPIDGLDALMGPNLL